MLIGFTSCENVTEESIIGKWQLKTILAGGVTVTDDNQIWEFASDHSLYLSWPEESIEGEHPGQYSGKWSLEGNKLSTAFWPVPFTVTKLTSTTLVAELSAEGSLTRYTFIKVK